MKQLYSSSNDRDVFDFVKDALENTCDYHNCEIAIPRLAEWMLRPSLNEDGESDDEKRIADLESEVAALENIIAEAQSVLER